MSTFSQSDSTSYKCEDEFIEDGWTDSLNKFLESVINLSLVEELNNIVSLAQKMTGKYVTVNETIVVYVFSHDNGYSYSIFGNIPRNNINLDINVKFYCHLRPGVNVNGIWAGSLVELKGVVKEIKVDVNDDVLIILECGAYRKT